MSLSSDALHIVIKDAVDDHVALLEGALLLLCVALV